ncbi:MAG: pyruvate ferredoxin oxidoreductase delta subunit [Clostridia bacterium]|nr:pyruvate ferredoxin oxidoreductase delta subunit [Clostridia bacterium]
MAEHPWNKKRPLSAWLPAGWSGEKGGTFSRNEKPVLDKDSCHLCSICWLYCPDGAIRRGQVYSIDYSVCRGCGVCAAECPRQAITMVLEGSN